MSKDVKFNIKLTIDGKDHVVTAAADVKNLAQQMGIAKTQGDDLRNTLLKFNNIAQPFQNAFASLHQLTGLMQNYTAASAEQVQAETKLATVMRQRMSATDEQIESVKKLAKAQQELGVIGDEVQLAGVQQLATFLNQKSSIDTLLPAMNNLLAQQKGLSATGEDAVTIGNLMGKAMQGQASALRRAGITFDAAQEKVLKYGTESQRAAMLAQIITNNVGNMNAELSKTDAGKAKQTANAIGDLKEKVGALFASVEPTIVAVGEFGLALSAIGTTWQGVRGLLVFMKTFAVATKIATIATFAQAAASKVAAIATAFWGNQVRFANHMQIAWTFGAKGFVIQAVAMRVAIMGLMAVTGVGLAILAVSSIVSLFSDKMGGATDEMKKAEAAVKDSTSSNNAETESIKQARAALEINISKLKDFHGTKQQEKKIVEEMNDTYGETMGYFSTVSDWYHALIKNSEAYCRQMIAEAKARNLANQIAEKEQEKRNLIYNEDGTKKKYNKQNKQKWNSFGLSIMGMPIGYFKEIENSSDLNKVNAKVKENDKSVASLRQQLKDTVKEAGNIKLAVHGSAKRPSLSGTPHKVTGKTEEKPSVIGSIDWYEKRLEVLRKKINATGNENVAKALQADYNAVEQEFKDYKIKIGLEKPDKVEVKTYIEKLQDELNAAKKIFENATTIEARVNASAKVDEIQAKINEATNGKLTIAAEVEPSYITQGSVADKRQSYNNAQQNANRIQQDYDIGLIGMDDALMQVAELNLQLEKLGLKPVEIKVMTDDLDKSKEKLKEAQDGLTSFFGSVAGLGSALELPELNAAGTVAQAIATIALSFAQALAMSGELGPWGWVAFAATGLAQLATIISSVKGATAFANGGIVSGPTMALVGEYAGASNNPEVIAPLDKLRSMIQPGGGILGGAVQFRIEGRHLVGVLANETRIGSKSGRRTNIKI